MIELRPAAIELNLSCPNVEDEFGVCLATQKDSSYQVTKAVKKNIGKIPLICKLSPNVPNIGEIAKACEAAGASAISAINTVGPGMVIDIYKKRPILGNKKGGVSGPAIKPIAIRCVFEIYEAVKIPILGMGGISNWQDAVEMMMAGASLVGVGSAVYLRGWGIYGEILIGLKDFLRSQKIPNIKNLIGIAH
jgi:dihydroorotate dehydrogenase (NAD+) catalytic subunit